MTASEVDERAWRFARRFGITVLALWPIAIVAAFIHSGLWTLLISLPTGPVAALGVMCAAERLATSRSVVVDDDDDIVVSAPPAVAA